MAKKQEIRAPVGEICELPLDKIDPFPDHPYKVVDDDDMDQLVESIRAKGIIVLICFSICLSEKYDKDLSVGFFIFVMFAVQYVSIAFIGKKYNVDKYDSVEEFIDDNPGVEKWIIKTALERMKGKA